MMRLRTDGLLRRLLLFIVLFSLCFTVLASSVQLYFEYRREMRDIEARMALIRAGYLASLERSLWDLDEAQLDTQLRGLVDFLTWPGCAWSAMISSCYAVRPNPRGRCASNASPRLPTPRGRPGTWASWK